MDTSTIIASEKSTHECPVFHFDFNTVRRHENADRLGVFSIPETDYSYILNLEDWAGYQGNVAWIPPDSLVDTTRPEFQFLIKEGKYKDDSTKGGVYARIKAKRLRGIVSYGLMIPVPKDITDGTEYLGVKHYEAPTQFDGANTRGAPSGTYFKYDVDSFLKYGRKVFKEGEEVFVTQKIHGQNCRFVFKDGEFYVGTRSEWKREFISPPKLDLDKLIEQIATRMDLESAIIKANEIYTAKVTNFKRGQRNRLWQLLDETHCIRTDEITGIKQFLIDYPGHCVYGEAYGAVQKGFPYDCEPGQIKFAAFDILCPDGRWMDVDERMDRLTTYEIPTVPVVGTYCFSFEKMVELAEMPNMLGQAKCSEGIVIETIESRWDDRLGRVKLKLINPAYLERD